jgi:histidyl-tRNA synthetase
MNLVKPETLAPRNPWRILIKVISDDVIKEAFQIAARLRKAGYIAELDFDGRQADWTLEIKSGGALALVGKASSKKTGAKSIDEVLKYLEGQGGA